MADQIKCLPLVKTTDGPLFNEKPGTLSEITNMALQPGGFAEARGGIASLIPNGGTAPTWLSAGGYSMIHQLTTSQGWIRTYDQAAAVNKWSSNRQNASTGWLMFPTGIVDDACYFGCDAPFSRIGVSFIATGVATSSTIAYEYWNGAAWSALTTAETLGVMGAVGTVGLKHASWTMPSNWAASSEGDSNEGHVYAYWMRVRISAINTMSFLTRVNYAFGIWQGRRELYVGIVNPLAGAANASIKRFDQNGTTGEAFAVAGTLFSGWQQPFRAVSYRGRLFMVNGKDAIRWDGANVRDIGLPAGTWAVASPLTTAAHAGALAIGTYRYYAAWAYGPLTVDTTTSVTGELKDLGPMYGYGQASTIGDITLGAASWVTPDFTGTVVPVDASGVALYRTQDLTTADPAKYDTFPAFLYAVAPRQDTTTTSFVTSFGSGTPIVDKGENTIYPPITAWNFDIQPPPRAGFAMVHQNRLLLGTADTWYWSDPFVPDRFRKETNYISLAKATGGRHTGGGEFADQAVLFTEDQTWGLTNIDLDVPNLYPIHPGVGCIAPDSVATGDGLIVWAARDGIYAWDGGRTGPKKVSWDWNQTFGKMSYETHGGSRAIIHNYHYDIRLASPDYSTTQGIFRLNLLTMQWSTITFAATATDTLYPFGPIYGPLGSEDPGGLHPVYAHGAYSGANGFKLYLGEQTTQDDGTSYSCSGTGHFPLPPGGTFVPQRILAYYMAADGWGTPALTFPPGTNIIGDPLGAVTSGTPDAGSDYSVVGGTPAEAGAGTSDLRFKFTVASAASGTVGRQRLFGLVLEGRRGRIRVGSV